MQMIECFEECSHKSACPAFSLFYMKPKTEVKVQEKLNYEEKAAQQERGGREKKGNKK